MDHDVTIARIQAFVDALGIAPAMHGAEITKAGIVPFLRGVPWCYYVMKPPAGRPELPPPEFQLCKGTRMCRSHGAWQDMRGGVTGEMMEPLAVTAIREGIEELGLVPDAMVRLIELGAYDFTSAKNGAGKRMWLFACEMADADAFLPDSAVAAATQARGWLSLEEFEMAGRADHRAILCDIDVRLKAME